MADIEQGSTVIVASGKPSRRVSFSKGLFWVAVVLAVLAMGTAYGFNRAFPRNGEAALSYVPDTAGFVTVVDLQPSMGQYLAFKKIAQALDLHGISAESEKSLQFLYEHMPEAKEIKPYLRPSLAGAVLTPSTTEGSMAEPDFQGYLLISVSNAAAVEKIISRGKLQPSSGTIKIYQNENAGVYAGVVDSYLLLSTSPQVGMWVDNVRNGTNRSIDNSPAFKQIRANIDSDANVMFFITDKGSQFVQSMQPASAGMRGLGTMAFGLAVRDDGLSLTSFSPAPLNPGPEVQPLLEMKPLRVDMMSYLPAGAYMVGAISDSAKYYSVIENAAGKEMNQRGEFQDMERSVKQEMGITLKECIHEAFSGDAVMALYPLESKVEGCDALIVLDDANGANPADVATRLRASIERAAAKENGEEFVLVDSEYGGAKVVSIDGKTEDEFKSVFDPKNAPKSLDLDPYTRNKTLAYATYRGVLLFSTSEELLHRAIDAYQGKGVNLSSDPQFASSTNLFVNAQEVFILSPSRVAQGIESLIRWNALEGDMPPQAKSAARDFIELCKSTNKPIVGSVTISKAGFSGKAFIPMDYDAVITYTSKQIKAVGDLANEASREPVGSTQRM